MDSWWDLGEWSGHSSLNMLYFDMECAYCGHRKDYEVVSSFEKSRADGRKKLLFQTLQCGNCANYTLLLRSDGSSGLIGHRRIPYPLKVSSAPSHWPDDVGRYWIQARRSIETESWDAAAIVIRSALQLAVRYKDAKGKTLQQEVSNLVETGLLPPLMEEWSTEVRLLGNEGTHPKPGAQGVQEQDVKDMMRFLESLLEYLFTLPHRIEQYRKRKQAGSGKN
jgi:hypothetical protein